MLGIIPHEFYEVKDMKEHCGWSTTATYGYMKQGLVYHQVGKRRYMKGEDIIHYVESKRRYVPVKPFGH
jgi:hypothetical protein